MVRLVYMEYLLVVASLGNIFVYLVIKVIQEQIKLFNLITNERHVKLFE